MKLVAMYIQNFRSVRNAVIEDIDNFNVLIGKNNSGKSNILSGIHAFFNILSNGYLVSSNPGIGNTSDFTAKDVTNPIKLAARFTPDPGEIESLLGKIREERPEIRTALDAIPHELALYVRMSILPPPRPYSFVQELSLSTFSENPQTWSLLQVGPESAAEIHKNYRDSQVAQREQESLTRLLGRFDIDDWRRARRENEPYMLRAIMDASGVSAEIIASVRAMLEASESFAEFQTALRTRLGKLEEETRLIAEKRLTAPVQTFSGVEDRIPEYIKDLIQYIGRIKILYLREQRPQIGGEEAQKILNLKTRRGGSETLTRIQKVVAQLLGVRVDAFSADVRPRLGERFPTNAAELDVDDFLVELNGSGIRESLRLILDATFEEPAILLVEEPEIHLHPGLETAMMHFLKEVSTQSQVFITTHSTNFLDSGDYQRIYLVTKDKTTSIEPLALQELEERIPIELGIRLSSLFMYDRLIFVEGPSDELIIRELCNTLAVNLSRGNVGFILLRGIGNLSYYAAKETLEFLQKRNVRITFLMDRDERADSEITRIRDALGSNIVLFPTKSRELENYLIIPRAVAKYMSTHIRTDNPVDEKKIETLIEEKTEKLKGRTLLKHLCHHVRPIYPDRQTPERALDVAECAEQFREIVAGMRDVAEQLLNRLDSMREDYLRY